MIKTESKKNKRSQNCLKMNIGTNQNPVQLTLTGYDKNIQISFNSKDGMKSKQFCYGHRQIWIPPPAKTSKRGKDCILNKYPTKEIMLSLPEDGKFMLPDGLPLVIQSSHLENFKAAFYPQLTDAIPSAKTSTSSESFDDYTKRIRENYEKQYSVLKESEKLLKEHESKKKVLAKYVHSLKRNMEEISRSIKEIEKHDHAREQDTEKKITLSQHISDRYRKYEERGDKSLISPGLNKSIEEIKDGIKEKFPDRCKENEAAIKQKIYVHPTEIHIPVEKLIKKQIKRDQKHWKKTDKSSFGTSQNSILAENAMIKLADNMRKSKILVDSALKQEEMIGTLQNKYIQGVEELYEDQQRLLKEIYKALDTSSSSLSSDDGILDSDSGQNQPKDRLRKDKSYKTDNMKNYADILDESKKSTAKFKLNSMPDIAHHTRNKSLSEKLAMANFELEKLKKELQLAKTKEFNALKSETSNNDRNKEMHQRNKEEIKSELKLELGGEKGLNIEEVIGSIIHNYNFLRTKECTQNAFKTTVTQKVKSFPHDSSDEQKPSDHGSVASLSAAQNAIQNLNHTMERLVTTVPKEVIGKETPLPFVIEHQEENIKVKPLASNKPESDTCTKPEIEENKEYKQIGTSQYNEHEMGIHQGSPDTDEMLISKIRDSDTKSRDKLHKMDSEVKQLQHKSHSRRRKNFPNADKDERIQVTDKANLVRVKHKGSSGFEIEGDANEFRALPAENHFIAAQSGKMDELPEQRQDYVMTQLGRAQRKHQEIANHQKTENESNNWLHSSKDASDFRNIKESTRLSERDWRSKVSDLGKRARVLPDDYYIHYRRKGSTAAKPDVSEEVLYPNNIVNNQTRLSTESFQPSACSSMDSRDKLVSGNLNELSYTLDENKDPSCRDQNQMNHRINDYHDSKDKIHSRQSSTNQWFQPDIYEGSTIEELDSNLQENELQNQSPQLTLVEGTLSPSELHTRQSSSNQWFQPDIYEGSTIAELDSNVQENEFQNQSPELTLVEGTLSPSELQENRDYSQNGVPSFDEKAVAANGKDGIRADGTNQWYKLDTYHGSNISDEDDKQESSSADGLISGFISDLPSGSQEEWYPFYLPKNEVTPEGGSNSRGCLSNGNNQKYSKQNSRSKSLQANHGGPQMKLNQNYRNHESSPMPKNCFGGYTFPKQGTNNATHRNIEIPFKNKEDHLWARVKYSTEHQDMNSRKYDRRRTLPANTHLPHFASDRNQQQYYSFKTSPTRQQFNRKYDLNSAMLVQSPKLNADIQFRRNRNIDTNGNDYQKHKIRKLYDDIMS